MRNLKINYRYTLLMVLGVIAADQSLSKTCVLAVIWNFIYGDVHMKDSVVFWLIRTLDVRMFAGLLSWSVAAVHQC